MMLHRLRTVQAATGQGPADRHGGGVKDLLRGDEPGLCGARPKGKKVLIVVAVERREPRCRMAILRDGSADPHHSFVVAHIEPGSTVATDGWRAATKASIGSTTSTNPIANERPPLQVRASAHCCQESIHIASLAKRSHVGTHQGHSPPELSQRIRFPLQPMAIEEQRPRLLPAARTRG